MKKLLSGIQPTNKITLGNYLGAIKQYVAFQGEFVTYFFVPDLHAITNPSIDIKTITENIKQNICLYCACGLDLKKNNVFIQSDVPAHTGLANVLMSFASVGELSRMTQYKDKSNSISVGNNTTTIPVGLFTYPILMSADILLYDVDAVPVGADQKQHLELTRTIATRMNNKYGKMFTVPETYLSKTGARITDLHDSNRKMSKSSPSEKGTIFVLEDLELTRNKIMSAKTDSLNKVKYDTVNQPCIANLISIYASLANITIEEIETKYIGQNYGVFKRDLADVICNDFKNIQDKYNVIYTNYSSSLLPILKDNAKRMNVIANKKLDDVYKKIGFR